VASWFNSGMAAMDYYAALLAVCVTPKGFNILASKQRGW
jgi:hypothetical protein